MRQRAGAEVRAVLVNQIPNAKVFQSKIHIGDFKENHGAAAVANRAADIMQKNTRLLDVLQNVPATDQIRFIIGVALRIKVSNKNDALGGVMGPLERGARIETNT